MKDVKSAYLEAKLTNSDQAISNYVEAIQEAVQNNPLGYLSNLEYIINSDVGLTSLTEFVHTYGLAIPSYEYVYELLEKCKDKAVKTGKPSNAYENEIEALDDYKKKYKECFNMYEYYGIDDPTEYVKTYYGTTKGIQNRKLAAGMIQKFGEKAIPDAIITASYNGGMYKLFEYVVNRYPPMDDEESLLYRSEASDELDISYGDHTFFELAYNAFKPFVDSKILNSHMYEYTFTKLENDLLSNLYDSYRESVIMGEEKPEIELTRNTRNFIENLIAYKEYQLTGDLPMETKDLLVEGISHLYDVLSADNGVYVEASDELDRCEDLEIDVEKLDLPEEITIQFGSDDKVANYTFKVKVGRVYNEDGKIRHDASIQDVPLASGLLMKLLDDEGGFNIEEKIPGITKKLNSYLVDRAKEQERDDIKYKNTLLENMKTAHMKARKLFVKTDGHIGLEFSYDLDPEHGLGIDINLAKNNKVGIGDDDSAFEYVIVQEDIADSVIPMQPTSMSERMLNTTDKKSGDAPRYISANHDMADFIPGSKEPKKKVTELDPNEDDDSDPLSSYRRPNEVYDSDKTPDDYKDDEDEDELPQSQSGVNNFYYYTYNNSLNKNTHSFNKDNSRKDDHSVHRRTIDRSTNIKDSYNTFTGRPREGEYKNSDSSMTESSNEKSDTDDYVPLFGICKSYSMSKERNDGTSKSASEIRSIRTAKNVKRALHGDNYSHAIISFNDDLTEMYSFAGHGFVVDTIEDDSFMATKSIYVCAMFLPREDWNRMHDFCKNMKKHPEETKYASVNLARMFLGKPIKQDKRFICSSFTAYILAASNPKNLQKDYSRFMPEDVTILPRAFYVMNFKDREDFHARKEEFKNRVKEIYRSNIDEIREYNNELPKLLLKDKMDKNKTLDKIIDSIIDRSKK